MNPFRAWRPIDAALLGVLSLAAVVAAWPAWADMFSTGWSDPEQSHVILAIPVAIWLAWIRRARLINTRPAWSLAGPLVIAAAWALGDFGLRAAQDVFWHLAALLAVVGAALTIVGPRVAWRFAVPMAALLALLPIPGVIRLQIAQPLQEISAVCSQYLLEIAGIPVARSGNMLVVNNHPVVIAEACNGMRMVAALGVVAYTFAFSIPAKPAVRVLLLALSPVLAVVVNIIRLIPTVLFYGYTSDGFAQLFHDLSGWLMMLVALGVLWAFMRLLKWMELPVLSYGALRD
ncbi:MAG: exosortase/archaeosortase family protein [Planctomycetota bacterium]